MKTTLFYILSILCLFSCSKKQTNQSDPKIIISGEIVNFNQMPDYNVIELSMPDVLEQRIHIKKTISSSGEFKFEFDLDHATNAWLRYENNFPVFISPGDSIHLRLDNSFIINEIKSEKELYAHLYVTGTSERMNREVAGFLAYFEDSVFQSIVLSDTLTKMEPLPAKEYLEQQLEKQYVALDKFNRNNNTSDHFQEWANTYLKYRTWSILFQYPSFHSFYNRIERPEGGYSSLMPDEYFNFLDTFENCRTDRLFESRNYIDFLRGYIGLINERIPQDTIRYYRSLYDSDFERGFNFFSNYFLEHEEGFLKDLLIANHYYRTLKDGHYERLVYVANFSQIEDEKLRDKVQRKFYAEQKINEDPELDRNLKINEEVAANEFLSSLIEKYKNEVLYIDFWAPWCNPCMAEITFAQELKKVYEEEAIVFVYLGTNCTRESWETTIKEKNITGEHYLLSKKQIRELNNIFDIRGIPHYVLLDKEGNVAAKFAPRPSSGEILQKSIDELL